MAREVPSVAGSSMLRGTSCLDHPTIPISADTAFDDLSSGWSYDVHL
jgi:hypothetical protein